MQRDYEAFISEFCMEVEKNDGIIRRGIHLLGDAASASEEGNIQMAWGRDKDLTHVFSIRTADLYRRYRKGQSTEELIDELLKNFSDMDPDDLDDVAHRLEDYNTIRGRLFIRAINYDRNKEQLEKCIYRRVGDVAQTLYVRAGSHGNILTSGKIPRELLGYWKRDETEVFDAALLNTFFVSPPRLYRWEKFLTDPSYAGENFMDMMKKDVLSKGPAGNCISTTEKTNGAIAAFMPGVLPRISDLLESDLILAFTSIHEVMVHSSETASPADIRSVLSSTIDECTSEEDFLSKQIYFYDRHEGHVICLEDD